MRPSMKILCVLGLGLLLGVAACSSGQLAPDGGVDTTPMAFGCAPISDSALAGCRSSDEPNCERCCLQTEPDYCSVWAIPCSTVVAGQSVGQYCGVSGMAGQCPADCRPCASCSKYSEATMCSLMPTIGACDCANIDIGVDPCFSPQSCACLCRGYEAAVEACPP